MGIAIFILMPIPITFTRKIFCGHIMVWISLTLSICRHNCFHAIIFWDVSPTCFQPRGPKMPNMMFSLFYVEQLFFNQFDDFFFFLLLRKFCLSCIWLLPFLRYKWVKLGQTPKILNFASDFDRVYYLDSF